MKTILICVLGMLGIALSGCTVAAVKLDNPGALDASGRQIGTRAPSASIDIGAYRVSMSSVYAARVNPVPDTLMFWYAWSPEGVRRLHRAKGYPKAAPEDVEHWAAMLRQAPRSRLNNVAIEQYTQDTIAALNTSEFEYIVFPNGSVGTCARNMFPKCNGGVSLTRAEQQRLAALLLAKVRPECRLGRVDPLEVAALAQDYMLSSARNLLVAVLCD